MNDLDRVFRSLDEIPTTDLSRSIEHRAVTGSDLEELSTTRKPPRRLVAAVVAFAVFGAAAFFAWQVLQPLQMKPTPGDSIPSSPWASYSQGWTELPSPPVVHQGAALVWTGAELLYWGGFDEGTNALTASGYAFDPTNGTWAPLPEPPLVLGDPTGVWTGTEAIFVGDDARTSAQFGDLAYDPTTRSWRVLADAPWPDAAGSVTAWTGTELIRFGGGKAGDPSNVQGVAYDPASDAWTRIADAPIGLNAASALWDGHEMIVFGSLLNDGNHAASVAAVGEAYDPATDSWRVIAPSTLSPQASSAVWVPGLGMFAWDYATQGAWYDPVTDSWSDQQKLPLEAGECYPDSVRATIQSVFAFYCGNVAVYDPAEGRWMRVGGGLTDVTIEANGQAYQLYRFATLAQAGDVVALAATGITVESGVPCYGCSGAPTSFWIYKP